MESGNIGDILGVWVIKSLGTGKMLISIIISASNQMNSYNRRICTCRELNFRYTKYI